MNFKRRISKDEVGFQMGPMLDIIFILLIQFMVATMFANREDWFKISVPTASHGSDQQEQISEIVLNLRQNGELFLDKGFADVSAGEHGTGERLLTTADWGKNLAPHVGSSGFVRLKSELARYHKHNPHLKVVIRADARTDHGMVVTVLDACAELSIRNVAFATQKPSE